MSIFPTGNLTNPDLNRLPRCTRCNGRPPADKSFTVIFKNVLSDKQASNPAGQNISKNSNQKSCPEMPGQFISNTPKNSVKKSIKETVKEPGIKPELSTKISSKELDKKPEASKRITEVSLREPKIEPSNKAITEAAKVRELVKESKDLTREVKELAQETKSIKESAEKLTTVIKEPDKRLSVADSPTRESAVTGKPLASALTLITIEPVRATIKEPAAALIQEPFKLSGRIELIKEQIKETAKEPLQETFRSSGRIKLDKKLQPIKPVKESVTDHLIQELITETVKAAPEKSVTEKSIKESEESFANHSAIPGVINPELQSLRSDVLHGLEIPQKEFNTMHMEPELVMQRNPKTIDKPASNTGSVIKSETPVENPNNYSNLFKGQVQTEVRSETTFRTINPVSGTNLKTGLIMPGESKIKTPPGEFIPIKPRTSTMPEKLKTESGIIPGTNGLKPEIPVAKAETTTVKINPAPGTTKIKAGPVLGAAQPEVKAGDPIINKPLEVEKVEKVKKTKIEADSKITPDPKVELRTDMGPRTPIIKTEPRIVPEPGLRIPETTTLVKTSVPEIKTEIPVEGKAELKTMFTGPIINLVKAELTTEPKPIPAAYKAEIKTVSETEPGKFGKASKTEVKGQADKAGIKGEAHKTEGSEAKPKTKPEARLETKNNTNKAKVAKTDTVDIKTAVVQTVEVREVREVRIKESELPLVKSQLNFISNHLTTQIKNGISSMELVLQPEHLGKIQMLLQSSDGIVSVQILAQTSEALNLLNANSHSIKDAIEQQGIELNDVNINLAQNSQDQPTHQEGRSDNTSTIPNVPHERIPKVDNFIESTKHSDNLLNVLA